MLLFLSYAHEDKEIAFEIVTWFRQGGVDIFYFEDPLRRGSLLVEQLESEIEQADAFLLLMSPAYMASGWCRMERDFALTREAQRTASTQQFLHVLLVSDGECPKAGFLRLYDWHDLTTAQSRRESLSLLLSRFGSSRRSEDSNGSAENMTHGAPDPGRGSSSFVNRRSELDRVIGGLTQAGGPPFWLVISPPELGKSWFLKRLSVELEYPEGFAPETRRSPWRARLVDVREQPAEARADASLVLARLFGLEPTIPATIDPDTLQQIAREIVESRKPYLCLLDSAELLGNEAIRDLRSSLGQIYEIVEQAGEPDARLAFVVASQFDRGWRGVAPHPRMSILALSEFNVSVVTTALEDLARQTNHPVSPSELAAHAVLLHRFCEGLPALLERGLKWIETEEWRDLERLDSRALFDQLIQIYVEKELLSPGSLFPWGGQHLEERQQVLEKVLQVLARYRLFTQSHLQDIFDHRPALREAVERAGWSIDGLWRALDRTPLLSRPLDEPWQEIHPAIRRLLFRHHYRSPRKRADAHRQARSFVGVWTSKQGGTEQIVGLVECLWHEASMLLIDDPEAMRDELVASAKSISLTLKPFPAYTVADVRREAADRVGSDGELQEALSSVPGLLGQLQDAIGSPEQASTK